MATRNRMPPWHETFVLRDKRELLLRPIRPEDAEPLQGVFPLFGPEEVRDRFLHAVGELTPDMADALVHPSAKTAITLVAAEPLPPGEAVVGAIARASVVPGTRDAEFAILISRFLAGQGLGRQLMRKLVKWARGKYLDRLYGDVAVDNEPMLRLATSLGFQRQPHPGAEGLVRVSLDLVG